MAIVHNFVTSNNIGGIGESIFYILLDGLSPGDVQSVVKEKEWRGRGIDFILQDVYYDTKFDTKAFSTGNVALETVSRKEGTKVIKKGWVHTSQADCVAYIFLENSNWSIYFFTVPEMQKMVRIKEYETKSIKNYGYESEVVLVPIKDLEHKAKMSFPVVGEVDLSVLRKVHEYLRENKE